jgi:DNA-binding CsgD family transcriptional regulator
MPKTKSKDHLLPREIEILDLMSRSYSPEMVADKLFISVFTVYKHLQNAYDRNGVTEVAALIIIAIEEGHIRVTVFK